jgi:hypothetical protein
VTGAFSFPSDPFMVMLAPGGGQLDALATEDLRCPAVFHAQQTQ